MDLYLLRHGIAAERGSRRHPTDADRPLTAEGREKLVRVARAMQALELQFDCVLSSPLVRARQTAELVAQTLGCTNRIASSDHLAPDGSPRALIQAIQGRRPPPESLLLVGHEPYLSGLVAFLTAGGPGLEVVLKKGGLCKLEVARLRAARCAALAWLLTPRHMALMG